MACLVYLPMHLQILPLSETAREFYVNHGTFHAGDSGLDLFIVEDFTVKAGETAFLKLGFKAAAFSEGRGVSWLLLPRSSISKTPLRLANSVGLIDAGYRGELLAAVDNIRNSDFTVKKGERYFQAVAFGGQPIQLSVLSEGETHLLGETARGEAGFGSTSSLAKKPKVLGADAEAPASADASVCGA